MRYNTVLFDADGTLLDFGRGEREAFCDTMACSGINANDKMIEDYSRINDMLWKRLEKKEIERSYLLHRRFEQLCELYNIMANTEKMSDDYVRILATKGYLLDGAEQLLSRLFGRVRMYIITNGVESVQRGRCEMTGIEKYFDGIFISGSVGFYKPDVRFFEHVANHIAAFEPESTLVVGDSLSSDIKGGNAFGIDTCWYNPEKKDLDRDIIPTFTAFDFDTVYDIIAGRKGALG